MKRCLVAAVLGTICLLPLSAAPVKQGSAKAQGQVAGAEVSFGAIYTMADGWNLQLLSAQYSLEPHNDYGETMAAQDEKLLVITYAIKNSRKEDNFTNGYTFVAVDENEKNYENGSGATRLAGTGCNEFSVNLKPGQGVGQDGNNRLTAAIVVPADAKIKKILVKQGRAGVAGEQVLRYSIAGPNAIGKLPAYLADATGEKAVSPAPAKPAQWVPNGYCAVRFDGLAEEPDATVNGQKAAEGKRFVSALFTARNATLKKVGLFYLDATQFENMRLRDGDGQKYSWVPESRARKLKVDEAINTGDGLEPKEEIRYRLVFEIPKSVKPASLEFGGGRPGHVYRVDL